MDKDRSGTVSRMEWVSYLAAPPLSPYHMGNNTYYEFPMRDLFEKIDFNRDGSIDFDELVFFIETDLGETFSLLDERRRRLARPQIYELAENVIAELKRLALEANNQNVAPNTNPRTLNWVEFKPFSLVCKA